MKRKATKMAKDLSSSSSSALQSVFCKICMETLQAAETFRNNSCGHAFCLRCLRRYIEAKVHEKYVAVKCPEIGCEGTLDPDFCKDMLPRTLVMRLYCPFKDCSKLIPHDISKKLRQLINCPYCWRLFCADCKVAWHYSMSCEDFRRFEEGVERETEEDLLLLKVARDEKWQRCPGCKYFVEKINGCLHIVCRCGLQFCYRCGKECRSGCKCSS